MLIFQNFFGIIINKMPHLWQRKSSPQPLQAQRETAWWALWSVGVTQFNFLENDESQTDERHRYITANHIWQEIEHIDV